MHLVTQEFIFYTCHSQILSFLELLFHFLLNDMIRSSDLDRMYWILYLYVIGIMCSICCVLCMMYLLQNRHWGMFISEANMQNILTSLATTVHSVLDLPFDLFLCAVFIRIPAKCNTYNWHYDVRTFWFGYLHRYVDCTGCLYLCDRYSSYAQCLLEYQQSVILITGIMMWERSGLATCTDM